MEHTWVHKYIYSRIEERETWGERERERERIAVKEEIQQLEPKQTKMEAHIETNNLEHTWEHKT